MPWSARSFFARSPSFPKLALSWNRSARKNRKFRKPLDRGSTAGGSLIARTTGHWSDGLPGCFMRQNEFADAIPKGISSAGQQGVRPTRLAIVSASENRHTPTSSPSAAGTMAWNSGGRPSPMRASRLSRALRAFWRFRKLTPFLLLRATRPEAGGAVERARRDAAHASAGCVF